MATPTTPQITATGRNVSCLRNSLLKLRAAEAAARESKRQDLSEGLLELDEKPPLEQAAFWKKCVRGKQAELESIGGLPHDSVFNDVLTRYFDSSTRGLNVVFDAARRDQEVLTEEGYLGKEGFMDALTEHLDMYPISVEEGATDPEFEELCDVVGMPCSRSSFTYTIRRLRIALLLYAYDLGSTHANLSTGNVYHMDYDDDFFHTDFAGSSEFTKTHYRGKVYHVPKVRKQTPVCDIAEYLYTSKMKRLGNVHWVHLHYPATELVLAVCQILRVASYHQGMLCDLHNAAPQISHSGGHDEGVHSDGRGYSWSSMIMPAVYLDKTSRESLQRYRVWISARQNRRHTEHFSAAPPRIRVAAVSSTLGFLWTSLEAKTLLTSLSEPHYVGKWNTDAPMHTEPGRISRLVDFLMCRRCTSSCCKSRKGHGGHAYEKLPQEDTDDLEKEPVSQELLDKLTTEVEDAGDNVAGELATDEADSCSTFEACFEKTLLALEAQNSMLRLGSHWLLLTRIAVNRTAELLDVLDVYQAAIARIDYLLHLPDTQNKDDLIDKVELVKTELGTLQRLVAPFSDYVVPHLIHLSPDLQREHPQVYHLVTDIENNIRTWMPKCKALSDKCISLSDEYDRNAADKMNDILNLLTFITFIITPMQVLTGVYGMNFRIMPELDWKHGYHMFWSLSLFLTTTFALVLICMKRNQDSY